MKENKANDKSNIVTLILAFLWDSLIVILCSMGIYLLISKLLSLPVWISFVAVILFAIITGKNPQLLRPWKWFKQSP